MIAIHHAALTHEHLLLTKCALATVLTWLAKQGLCYRVVFTARCHSQPAVVLPHWMVMPQLIVDLSTRGCSQHSRIDTKELPV